MRVWIAILAGWLCALGQAALAQGSLFADPGAANGAAFVDLSRNRTNLILASSDAGARPASGSLFSGRNQGSLFAPPPPNPKPKTAAPQIARLKSKGIIGLRQLIASAEAGSAGYDAVQHGAKHKPPKRPTEMTLAEINWWIKATPGQPHAIGRYQFIPATLRRLIKQVGLEDSVTFTPDTQDVLADQLLREAGLKRFLAGDLSRTGFMNNLAKIWAGLPTSDGKSHYHGYAGNYATITWAQFNAEMARIFPGR